jgi:hypothetical protein
MAELNPLRRHIIEDMKVRNLSPVTPRCYVHAMAKFAQFFASASRECGRRWVRNPVKAHLYVAVDDVVRPLNCMAWVSTSQPQRPNRRP